MDLGLQCHVCGQLNSMSAPSCSRCGTVLQPLAAPQPAVTPTGASQTVMASSSPSVNTAVRDAPGVQPRFDPATGQPLAGPEHGEPQAKTMFFGALQQQAVIPRLVVIKGEGGDGNTYHLQGTTTIIGRAEGEITFVEDPFLSPAHARFTSQNGRLFVQDMGSENGVFLRIKKPTPLRNGTYMLVGEQLLRLDRAPFSDGAPSTAGTYFYGSPRPNGSFRVVQCLAGGGEGRVASSDGNSLAMGREGNTLNFPDDRFISGHHARLDASSDGEDVLLTDTGSRNGTFVRIEGAQELFHGDYLFVGQQLLRVEIA
ncbi:MAG: FHA domain-containing protein [Deltaproteobacteria bacterium]|nr:FHA domain-containing protein [Deltaproteobacteria bacterium]